MDCKDVELLKMRQRLPYVSIIVFAFCSWFIGDFIGCFTHPGPAELAIIGALALLTGWRIKVAGDRRELLRKLALAVLSITIALILVEVWFIRHVVALTPGKEQQIIEKLKLEGKQSFKVDKAPGAFRILGLADSFGVWAGTSNYHYLIEKQLRQAGMPSVELINASIVGAAPGDEIAIWRAFVRYQPDLVLQGFYVGNDFDKTDGVLVQFHSVTWRHYFRWKELRPRHFLVRKWLFRLIKAWRVTGRLAYRWVSPRYAFGAGEVRAETGLVPHEEFLKTETIAFVTNFKKRGVLKRRWGHTLQLLEMTREEVEAQGGRYALVIHPDRLQLDERLQDTLCERLALPRSDFDLSQPQKFLHSWCEEKNVSCLDLLPAFQAQGDTDRVFVKDDTHYSELGNALAASEITRWLLEEKIVAPED